MDEKFIFVQKYQTYESHPIQKKADILIRKILSLIIIAFTIASCSTSKRVIKQDTSQGINKKVTIQQGIKQDTSIDGLKRSKRRISLKDQLEKDYLQCKGIPYKYGGTSFKGFDCSGFVQSTFERVLNINLPRSTREILKKGIVVPKSKLRIGDLVFFKPKNTYRHVGIFVGNNMFIHVSSSRGVIKSSLKEAYWMKYYFQSRRVF